MPEVFSKYFHKLLDFWKSMEKSQKIRIYIFAGIFVAVIIVSSILLLRPNYVPLISSNDQQEINEMRKTLNDNGIKHKLSDDKGTILVDSDDKNKAEMALITNGNFDSGEMKFEDAWSMIKLNSTESDKKKLWEEYKRNVLISKIKSFSNVKDAEVDLAIPEDSLFQKDQKPTAYVIVTPKNELTEDQVEGIVKVVASSVENLEPENVTVVDNYANVLNKNSTDSLSSEVDTQTKAIQQKQTELENKVYNLFNSPSDNFDSIKAVANPVLDFDTQTKQSQIIEKPDEDSDEGYVISRQKSTESVQNGTEGAAPGVDTNPGTDATVTYQVGGEGNSSYEKEDTTESFEYNRSTVEEKKAVGVMDYDKSTLAVTLWYGRKVTDENKLSQEFINNLISDVSKATGIPESNISVSKYKLAPIEETEDTGNKFNLKDFVDNYGIYVLLLILSIGLLIALIPRREKNLYMEEIEESEMDTGVLEAKEEKVELPEITLEEKSEVKKQIDRFVKEKPEAVAQLLRNWLSEEWE